MIDTYDCETDQTEDTIVVSRRMAREVGSCNFCDRQITQHGTRAGASVSVIRPWRGGFEVRACSVCAAQLKKAL